MKGTGRQKLIATVGMRHILYYCGDDARYLAVKGGVEEGWRGKSRRVILTSPECRQNTVDRYILIAVLEACVHNYARVFRRPDQTRDGKQLIPPARTIYAYHIVYNVYVYKRARTHAYR